MEHGGQARRAGVKGKGKGALKVNESISWGGKNGKLREEGSSEEKALSGGDEDERQADENEEQRRRNRPQAGKGDQTPRRKWEGSDAPDDSVGRPERQVFPRNARRGKKGCTAGKETTGRLGFNDSRPINTAR